MKTIQIAKGRRVAISSDPHVGHRGIIGYCRRPWLYLDTDNRRRGEAGEAYKVSDAALAAHDDAIIANINRVAGPDDVLFLLGDIAWGEPGGSGLKKLRQFRDRLACREIHVMVGNHDDETDLRTVFGDAFVYERLFVQVDGPAGRREAVLDHFGADVWHRSHHGSWLLFGHSHGGLDGRHLKNPAWLLSLDVGVDSHDFRPWLWHEELVPLMDSRRAAWQAWRDATYSTPKDKGGMAINGR